MTQNEVQHHLCSRYHHQSNGMAERWNRTLEEMLSSAGGDWEEKLPEILNIYRGTKHSVTGWTPHEVLFGEVARLPIDDRYGTQPSLDISHEDIIADAKAKMKAAENKMKREYDQHNKTRDPPNLNGQRVYWKNVQSNQTKKLKNRALGPFLAWQDADNPLTYSIVGRDGVTKQGVHIDQLNRSDNEDVPLDVLRHRGRPRRDAALLQGEV